uniref:Uncharacterized protein n=1 Tax=Anguilla anguilla TaxID=7936 RepID=A0A0E9QK11_ANGAN
MIYGVGYLQHAQNIFSDSLLNFQKA